MIRLTKKSLTIAALSISAALIAGAACAGGTTPHRICHNIGGPNDLGANCDGTGNCTYAVDGGGTITVRRYQFLGILIGASDNAAAAHIAHGDGFADAIFDPPLHLASVLGPHRASNVECIADRVIRQPPDPGN